MVPESSFALGRNALIKDSGTGSQGATIRIYVEKYSVDNLDMPTQEAVSDLMEIALKLSMLEKYTGRKTPTVIT
jgi:phosphoglucomutase